MDAFGDSTRSVHAGLPEGESGSAILPGPVFAAPFHLRGDPADSPYGYAREGHPTFAGYETALGELEGADCLAFASGMAASAAVILSSLSPGDVFVAPADGYFHVRGLAESYLEPRGVEVRRVPTGTQAVLDALDGARVVWIETPSNPALDVCDIAVVCAAAAEAGAWIAVDNTLATMLGQRPLDLGATWSVYSGTKALSGHGDILMGHVATRDADRLAALVQWREQTGGVPGPMEAWLAHRSLSTLAVRLERQCANAMAIAELLAVRPDVELVRYPGLADDPSHAVAARQMSSFGPVVSFVLSDAERAQAFLDASSLVIEATSFGAVHTTAERRARWGADAIAPGFVRLSAGIEDTADLLGDVARALDFASA
jgi:cystathionine gamma-lyase